MKYFELVYNQGDFICYLLTNMHLFLFKSRNQGFYLLVADLIFTVIFFNSIIYSLIIASFLIYLVSDYIRFSNFECS